MCLSPHKFLGHAWLPTQVPPVCHTSLGFKSYDTSYSSNKMLRYTQAVVFSRKFISASTQLRLCSSSSSSKLPDTLAITQLKRSLRKERAAPTPAVSRGGVLAVQRDDTGFAASLPTAESGAVVAAASRASSSAHDLIAQAAAATSIVPLPQHQRFRETPEFRAVKASTIAWIAAAAALAALYYMAVPRAERQQRIALHLVARELRFVRRRARAALLAVSQRKLEVPRGQGLLRVYDTGPSSRTAVLPTVVLYAGEGETGALWGMVAAELAPQARVVTVHRVQPGVDRVRRQPLASSAEDISAALRAAGVRGPVLIAGAGDAAWAALVWAGKQCYAPPTQHTNQTVHRAGPDIDADLFVPAAQKSRRAKRRSKQAPPSSPWQVQGVLTIAPTLMPRHGASAVLDAVQFGSLQVRAAPASTVQPEAADPGTLRSWLREQLVAMPAQPMHTVVDEYLAPPPQDAGRLGEALSRGSGAASLVNNVSKMLGLKYVLR